MEKISKNIEFSELLDVGQYMSDSIDKKRKDSCKYKLFAVVVHRGYDLFGGHYYAYVRGLDNNWYHANDESVTPVSIHKILKESAYILLYQRMSLPKTVPVKAQPAKAEEAPLAKTKGEAAKTSKSIIAELLGTKAKPLANHNGNHHEKLLIPEGLHPVSSDEKTPSTDGKTQSEMELDEVKEKPLRLLSPTSKRRKIQRLVQSINHDHAKRAKPEEHKIPTLENVKQKYFKADGVIQSWENAREDLAEREKIMLKESGTGEVRRKHVIDFEYDKGKTKKIKDKQKRKFEGLQRQLDVVQKLRKDGADAANIYGNGVL